MKERNIEEAEEEEEEEEENEKSAKELDDEIKRKKERQIFLDDVGVLVAMVAITLLAIVVVTIKVVIFQPTSDDTHTTFKPVLQAKDSKIKYTGNGFIPCKGYVPCRTTVEPND